MDLNEAKVVVIQCSIRRVEEMDLKEEIKNIEGYLDRECLNICLTISQRELLSLQRALHLSKNNKHAMVL